LVEIAILLRVCWEIIAAHRKYACNEIEPMVSHSLAYEELHAYSSLRGKKKKSCDYGSVFTQNLKNCSSSWETGSLFQKF